MTVEAGAARSGADRARTYRARQRRFDYVPDPEALRVIEAWREANQDLTLSVPLDHLIVTDNAAAISKGR